MNWRGAARGTGAFLLFLILFTIIGALVGGLVTVLLELSSLRAVFSAFDTFIKMTSATCAGSGGVILGSFAYKAIFKNHPTRGIGLALIVWLVANYALHFLFFPELTDDVVYFGLVSSFVACVTAWFTLIAPHHLTNGLQTIFGRVIGGIVFVLLGLMWFGPPVRFGYENLSYYTIVIWSVVFAFANVSTGWRYPDRGLFISFLWGVVFAACGVVPLYFLGRSIALGLWSDKAISIVLAYVMLGVSQVTEDLAAEPLSKPMWALGPTFCRMLFVGTTWFMRPFIGVAHSKQVARSVAFACLNVILTFVTTAAFIWVCLIASEHWFDNLALQILTAAVLLTVGGIFVAPLLSLLYNSTDIDSCTANRFAVPA
jgi:hypothetical protein